MVTVVCRPLRNMTTSKCHFLLLRLNCPIYKITRTSVDF